MTLLYNEAVQINCNSRSPKSSDPRDSFFKLERHTNKKEGAVKDLKKTHPKAVCFSWIVFTKIIISE